MATPIRLLTAAGVIALIGTTAPLAAAEPAEDRPYSQLALLADLDPNSTPDPTGFDPAYGFAGVHVTSAGTAYVVAMDQLYTVSADGTVGTVPGAWIDPAETADDSSVDPEPRSVTVADDGTIYVLTENTVRRVTPDGTGSLIAGRGEEDYDDEDGESGPAIEAYLWDPQDIAVDAAGNLYVADVTNDRIRKIDQNGMLTTIAGGGYSGTPDGSPATEVGLDSPRAVDVDAAGNVYFIEEPGRIRKISPDGTISVVLGQQGAGFAGDGGPAAEGKMAERADSATSGGGGLDVDAEGNIYFADVGNRVVRKIDTKGVLTTLGPLASNDISVAANGDVYQAVEDEVLVLRRKTTIERSRADAGPEPRWATGEPGTVRPVAGTGKPPADTDEPGPWVAAGPGGTAYVSDTLADQVYRVMPDGRREPFAGTGVRGNAGDDGPATRARLNHPAGIVVGKDGAVYIADSGNRRIRKVDRDGTITTHAEANAFALAVDGAGTLYYTSDQRIGKLDAAGKSTTIAGGGRGKLNTAVDGPATEVSFYGPITMAVAENGTVYFIMGSANAVYQVSPEGTLTTFATDPGPLPGDTARILSFTGVSLAAGPEGTVYLANQEHEQIVAVQAGTVSVIATVPGPGGIAVAGDGTRYVTGADRDTLHRIAPDGSVRTDSGLTAGQQIRDAGPATEVPIDYPARILVQPSGALTLDTAYDGAQQLGTDGVLGPLKGLPRESDDRALAYGHDGSVYVSTLGTVGIERRFPNGTRQPLVGVQDNKPVRTGVAALTQYPEVSGTAVTTRGDLYLTVARTLYRLGEDGTLAKAATFRTAPSALTAGPDGTLYVIADKRVLRVDARHRVTTIAGGGDFEDRLEIGDGGPATEAELQEPSALAVSDRGHVYIGTYNGVRKVAQDGTIGTLPTIVNPHSYDERYATPEALAVDRHGNLYYSDRDRNQVFVVVHADDVVLPKAFQWGALGLGVLVLAGLGALGYGVFRYRGKKAGLLKPAT